MPQGRDESLWKAYNRYNIFDKETSKRKKYLKISTKHTLILYPGNTYLVLTNYVCTFLQEKFDQINVPI